MFLATAGIDSRVSPPLLGAMEDFHSTGPAAAKALSPAVADMKIAGAGMGTDGEGMGLGMWTRFVMRGWG